MSSPAVDLNSVHVAYSRLTERFRTLWSFHQFLQGVHKTQFHDEPSYQIAFAPLYEQLKRIKETKAVEPPPKTTAAIETVARQLTGIEATLAEDEHRVSPHVLRQFFESVAGDDEKMMLAVLRFYFYQPKLTQDGFDKVDFLLTRVATLRRADGALELRSVDELQELCNAILSLASRETPTEDEVRAVVNVLDILRRDLEAVERFEDLARNKTLENIRTLKHRMGRAFYSPEVIQAVLASNVVAKKKWRLLYREEERRILESSRQLLEMESELDRDPRLNTREMHVDLERLKKEKEEFERQGRTRGVRPRDVSSLKDAINRLMQRVDPSRALQAAAEDVGSGPIVAPQGSTITNQPTQPTPIPPGVSGWRAEADTLTTEAASEILHSVDLLNDNRRRGNDDEVLARLRLETWEVRATLRVLKGRSASPDERLLFNAAVLRLRMDQEAQHLRSLVERMGEHTAPAQTLGVAGRCLVRARDLDLVFRRRVAQAAEEEKRELTRSRFRHLRAFAGLWLLYNTLGGS